MSIKNCSKFQLIKRLYTAATDEEFADIFEEADQMYRNKMLNKYEFTTMIYIISERVMNPATFKGAITINKDNIHTITEALNNGKDLILINGKKGRENFLYMIKKEIDNAYRTDLILFTFNTGFADWFRSEEDFEEYIENEVDGGELYAITRDRYKEI